MILAEAQVLIDKSDVTAIHLIGLINFAALIFCGFCLFLGERYKDKSAEALAAVVAILAAFMSVSIPMLSVFLWPW